MIRRGYGSVGFSRRTLRRVAARGCMKTVRGCDEPRERDHTCAVADHGWGSVRTGEVYPMRAGRGGGRIGRA